MKLQPEQVILQGKYRIEAMVGQGAFARVWRAEETGFSGRPVAIKEPCSERLTALEADEQARRFRQEVQLAAQLERYALRDLGRRRGLPRGPRRPRLRPQPGDRRSAGLMYLR